MALASMFLIVMSIIFVEAAASYGQVPSKYLEVPVAMAASSDAAPRPISLALEIPSAEEPLPFDTYLVPVVGDDDSEASGSSGGGYPVPSQNLQVPNADAWNPENDPALLYELPAELTKAVAPTHLHPKKYDRGVFDKAKPIAARPKEEIVLLPIRVQDYVSKQKQQEKTALSFAKRENQRVVEVDKVNAASGHHHHRQRPPPAHPLAHGGGERVAFHVHGHNGPKSYKWGFDTGKGSNRQFRYEESNAEGYVRGHYGYYDKDGKLRMVRYNSHPHKGFHAKGNFNQ